jgi:cytoskeletal protein RodZ
MMEKFGDKLKKIRLEKGMTLEEAHKQTKIHLNILKAIEEDSITTLSPVYMKGFIKIYSNFLGAGREGAQPGRAEQKAAARHQAPAEEDKELSGLIAKPLGRPSLAGLFPLKPKIIIAALTLALLLAGLFYLGKAFSSRRPAVSGRPILSAPAVLPKVALPARPAAAKAVKKEPPQPKPQKLLLGGEKRLQLSAREDVFIQVKLDGKTFFYGILKKGKSEAWKAKDKIELSVGDAGAVQLYVNEKSFADFGKKGQSRTILINKDGLTVVR